MMLQCSLMLFFLLPNPQMVIYSKRTTHSKLVITPTAGPCRVIWGVNRRLWRLSWPWWLPSCRIWLIIWLLTKDDQSALQIKPVKCFYYSGMPPGGCYVKRLGEKNPCFSFFLPGARWKWTGGNRCPWLNVKRAHLKWPFTGPAQLRR